MPVTPAAKTGLTIAGAIIAVSILKIALESTNKTPLNLHEARQEFVTHYNNASAAIEGYTGLKSLSRCAFGDEDTTLVCTSSKDMDVEIGGGLLQLPSLCGRGFKKAILAGADHKLDCTNFPLYHGKVGSNGNESWY